MLTGVKVLAAADGISDPTTAARSSCYDPYPLFGTTLTRALLVVALARLRASSRAIDASGTWLGERSHLLRKDIIARYRLLLLHVQ
jgi:hypothetical protein